MTETLERITFETSRILEFFSEKELLMQIGQPRALWPLALVKELIDNALDACEDAGIPPEIVVTVEEDAVSVQDNGPGLPVETLKRSLDYLVCVSDKAHYVSPTRGQLGNALKCVWAAPYVADGEQGRVDVITGGQTHRVDVTLDRIAEQPRLKHTVGPDGVVKTGTFVKMHWPEIASYLANDEWLDFYKVTHLLSSYAAFNPHADFKLGGKLAAAHERAATDWQKWMPGHPTSPHWYTVERLRDLIAAYIVDERKGGKVRTVREFVSEFAGLSGTAKQKTVTEAAGLPGAYLHDLIDGEDVSLVKVNALLAAMQAESRPIKPAALGTLGEAHFRTFMAQQGARQDYTYYAKRAGVVNGLPYVLEMAFGIAQDLSQSRSILFGLNWTPTLDMPVEELFSFLDESYVDPSDPAMMLVHLACPRFDFTDRGKSDLALPDEIMVALQRGIALVTKEWKQIKRKINRDDRLNQRHIDELCKAYKARLPTVKDAAYQVMEEAYLKASANDTLPANARQIMYAARPLVLELTGGQCWKQSSYFTQHLLPDFIKQYPDLTASWDVVFDDRGHFTEPHTGTRFGLGTLAVRDYTQSWIGDLSEDCGEMTLNYAVNTVGPTNRFRFALFVEKEGFNPLIEQAQLSERYDLAVMSTKGMSVTASRQLVERLSQNGVTILVLHDFDKAGFSIFNTLKSDTRRYQYSIEPHVIDLGLRLEDVRDMALASEPVVYLDKVDPAINLRASGATEDECAFLVHSDEGNPWEGERVELNAMTSDQLLTWLENKLEQNSVGKVVPNAAVLQKAYRRAVRLAMAQKALNEAMESFDDSTIETPEDLTELVETELALAQEQPWDAVIWRQAVSRSIKSESSQKPEHIG